MLNQRIRVLVGVLLTGLVLHFVPNRLLVCALLLVAWWLLFFPLTIAEYVLVVLAAFFFTIQDYVTLKAGLFAFGPHDVLLMPYYEPLLWGFYFVSIKRFVSGTAVDYPPLGMKGVAGLVVTSIVFSMFSTGSRPLLIATICSTLFLVTLFHTSGDFRYAACALMLGLVVEVFGVSTGLWSYPTSDFLGIPYWFATMWISVGLLGRRFALPAASWLANQRQRE
jgi:hypothetical protein